MTTKPNDPNTSRKEYKIQDHLGNTRVVLDGTGAVIGQYDYTPFGGILWQSAPTPRLSFIDKEKDKESGLSEFGVRKYDDEIGRFTSIDPDWEKYRSYTPYNYSENNPLVLKDPSGFGPNGTIIDYRTRNLPPGYALGGQMVGGGLSGAAMARGIAAFFSQTVMIWTGLNNSSDADEEVQEEAEAEEEADSGDEAEDDTKEKRSFSKKDREEGYEKSKNADGKPACEYCGRELKKEKGAGNSYEADHAKPHSKGGKSTQENLTPSCRDCNRSKGSKTVEEWQKWQENQRTSEKL